MPRCPVTCVWPGGESFSVAVSEAEQIVRDGGGQWEGPRRVRMVSSRGCGGRLSAKVGGMLAGAVGRREGWAEVMLEEINR
jgi:hypothetical protein